MGSVTAPERAEDTVAMAKLVFGDDFVENNCVTLNLINANSPMVFDETMLGAAKVYARHGQASVISPFISFYLIGIGLYILYKAFRPRWPRDVSDWIIPYVGGFGGLMDSIGGGGWGPVVTSTLLGRGHDAKKVIGSANFTEFAVTTVISLTFILTLGWTQLSSAAGLIVGGVLAAPVGAILVKHLPVRPLMIGVSLLIVATAIIRLL